jgi:hypothetical protein
MRHVKVVQVGSRKRLTPTLQDMSLARIAELCGYVLVSVYRESRSTSEDLLSINCLVSARLMHILYHRLLVVPAGCNRFQIGRHQYG